MFDLMFFQNKKSEYQISLGTTFNLMSGRHFFLFRSECCLHTSQVVLCINYPHLSQHLVPITTEVILKKKTRASIRRMGALLMLV